MRRVIIQTDESVEQFRFPHSKKGRIRLKWAMRAENWRVKHPGRKAVRQSFRDMINEVLKRVSATRLASIPNFTQNYVSSDLLDAMRSNLGGRPILDSWSFPTQFSEGPTVVNLPAPPSSINVSFAVTAEAPNRNGDAFPPEGFRAGELALLPLARAPAEAHRDIVLRSRQAGRGVQLETVPTLFALPELTDAHVESFVFGLYEGFVFMLRLACWACLTIEVLALNGTGVVVALAALWAVHVLWGREVKMEFGKIESHEQLDKQ